jgi:hypothetical protein
MSFQLEGRCRPELKFDDSPRSACNVLNSSGPSSGPRTSGRARRFSDLTNSSWKSSRSGFISTFGSLSSQKGLLRLIFGSSRGLSDILDEEDWMRSMLLAMQTSIHETLALPVMVSMYSARTTRVEDYKDSHKVRGRWTTPPSYTQALLTGLRHEKRSIEF